MSGLVQDEDGQDGAENGRRRHGTHPRADGGRRIAGQLRGRAGSGRQVKGQDVDDSEEDLQTVVSRGLLAWCMLCMSSSQV